MSTGIEKKNIALIGFMGAGKSTVSHCLKELLHMTEVEIDEIIVQEEGMAITEIFSQKGEPYFRDCESRVCLELQKQQGLIISCGGGTVMREENVVNLKKNSRIILLTATPETTLERVREDGNRPILNGHMNVEFIRELMEKREDKYRAAADLILATDGKTAEEICAEMIEKLAVDLSCI